MPTRKIKGKNYRFSNLPLTVRQSKQVKDIIKSEKEKKSVEAFNDNDFSGSTSFIHHLTPIDIGDNETQRDGLEVNLRRLQLKCALQYSPNTAASRRVRVVIFTWNSVTAPVISDILNTPTRAIEDQFYDKSRGYVMYDKLFVLDGITAASRVIDINKNLNNLHCQFVGSLAANISKGQIYIAFLTTVVGADLTYDYGSRVWYVEK